MSEHEPIAQIVDYARWLERSSGLDLHPPDRSPGVDQPPGSGVAAPASPVDPVEGEASAAAAPGGRARLRRRARGRVVALVAAAAVLAVVGWGVVQLASQDGQMIDTAALPQDPTGALFVLPSSIDPDRLGNARLIEIDEGLTYRQVFVVGTEDGEALTNLANVVVGPAPGMLGEASQQIQLTTGPAQLFDDVITVLARQVGPDWISVLSGPDQVDYVTEIMENLVLGADGVVSIGPGTGLGIIEAIVTGEGSASNASTSYELTPASDGPTITVQTGTAPSPLLAIAGWAADGTLSPARDFPGWEITRTDAGGAWHALTWQATPNRVIAVSGYASHDEIRAVAESLEVVDREAWQKALPDHSTGP